MPTSSYLLMSNRVNYWADNRAAPGMKESEIKATTLVPELIMAWFLGKKNSFHLRQRTGARVHYL